VGWNLREILEGGGGGWGGRGQGGGGEGGGWGKRWVGGGGGMCDGLGGRGGGGGGAQKGSRDIFTKFSKTSLEGTKQLGRHRGDLEKEKRLYHHRRTNRKTGMTRRSIAK